MLQRQIETRALCFLLGGVAAHDITWRSTTCEHNDAPCQTPTNLHGGCETSFKLSSLPSLQCGNPVTFTMECQLHDNRLCLQWRPAPRRYDNVAGFHESTTCYITRATLHSGVQQTRNILCAILLADRSTSTGTLLWLHICLS